MQMGQGTVVTGQVPSQAVSPQPAGPRLLGRAQPLCRAGSHVL